MSIIAKVSAFALAAACLVSGGVVSVPSTAMATTLVDLDATFSDTGLKSGLQHEVLNAAFTLSGDVIIAARITSPLMALSLSLERQHRTAKIKNL